MKSCLNTDLQLCYRKKTVYVATENVFTDQSAKVTLQRDVRVLSTQDLKQKQQKYETILKIYSV